MALSASSWVTWPLIVVQILLVFVNHVCKLPGALPNAGAFLAVQGYAVSAIQKVCAFQVAAGRPAPVTPEVRSFLDALCMSRSTDLQQRAYELQALLGLTADAVGAALPEDASCEDIEVRERALQKKAKSE